MSISPSPTIHVNRKYHIKLNNILSIKQKRWGSVWVEFIDERTKQTKIAVAKQDLGTLLNIVNQHLLMRGDKPFLMIKEQ